MTVSLSSSCKSTSRGYSSNKSDFSKSADEDANMHKEGAKAIIQDIAFTRKKMDAAAATANELSDLESRTRLTAKLSLGIATTTVLAAVSGGFVIAGIESLLNRSASIIGELLMEISISEIPTILAATGFAGAVVSGPASYVVNKVASRLVEGMDNDLQSQRFNIPSVDQLETLTESQKDVFYLRSLVALDKINNDLNSNRSKNVGPDTWKDYAWNAVTFGWYDVSYVKNMKSRYELEAGLYKFRIDLLTYMALYHMSKAETVGKS
jgi:hypothetical protein